MLARLWKWVKSLFGFADPVIRKPSVRHIYHWTLSVLMDEIDGYFASAQAPQLKGARHADGRVMMNTMGAIVHSPAVTEHLGDLDCLDDIAHKAFKLPGVCLAIIPDWHLTDVDSNPDGGTGHLVYAVKINRPVAGVPWVKGETVYELAMCFDHKGRRVNWSFAYACIDSQGNITPLKVIKNHNWGPTTYGRSYGYPYLASKKGSTNEQLIRTSLAWAINAWWYSESAWRVRVSKGKARLQFIIPENEIVAFFKSRDKTVTTPSGHRKTIIHAVVPHMRSNGQFVKGHFRGSQVFSWHGYDFSIIVPKFSVSLTEFDLTAHYEGRDEHDGIGLDKVMKDIGELANHVRH